MMSYLTYLLAGRVFCIKFDLEEEHLKCENVNNLNLDGMSLASFCQRRAVLLLSECVTML